MLFPYPHAWCWELTGQLQADSGPGRWVAQKRGSSSDFLFHSPLYLDLICSGSRTRMEILAHKLQSEKQLVVVDACPPWLSY